ncbi:phosphoenolpyruvate--protein phosphotransferase [Parvularcula dongshanensis]|nr:phosphoenolpyruvate--protein phosphotransferase [Parvularcula dongshanensis]
MAEPAEPQARLEKLVRAIAANMVADVCSIYVRRTSGALELFATQGLKPEAVHATRMAPGEGLVGWVADRRQPLSVTNAPAHPSFSYRAETGEDPLQAFLGVPVVRSGQVLGVLVVQNRTQRRYTDDEIEAAQIVATVLAEIVPTGDLLDEADTKEAQALLEAPESGRGAAVSAGIAIGTVALLEPDSRTHKVFAESVAAEKTRLEDAVAGLQKSVDEMIATDAKVAGVSREVLEVYRLFAYDRGWVRRIEEKVLSGLTAETAVEQVQAENRERMRAAPDPYLRERLHDLEDLSRRLIRALQGLEGPPELPEGAILMAETLGPAELLELSTDRLAGLVLADGGGTSHAAIVARSLGLPFVSGLPGMVESARPGDTVIVDGDTGEVHLRPPSDALRSYADKKAMRERRLEAYAALRDEPAVTKDGALIDLQMNAGLLLDMPHLKETGASGIGLFRTELPFLIGRTLPTAAEQEHLYREVLRAAGTKPVVFRTADIGSDKRATYMTQPVEANPAMGWRGLRVSLDREGLFRTQLRAMIAAAGGRELRVLLPLVTTVEEVEAARGVIEKELSRRKRGRKPVPSSVIVGVMIEIPSAAWSARSIAAASDFVSIGGNDLAQFFFAADRESALVSSRYDPLCPAFIGFVGRTISEAKAAGRPVGYCGEQASDPLMALVLMGLGLRSLSVTASSVAPLKAMIRSVDLGALSGWLNETLAAPSGELRREVEAYAEAAGVALPSWA